MIELKPCPFCGGKARIFEMRTMSWVKCANCGCETALLDTIKEAVATWNRRVNDATD